MANIEKEILTQSTHKPLVWKRLIDDVFSLWNITKDEVDDFIEQANKFQPSIKFTAEISEKEIRFLDTNVYKEWRFLKESLPTSPKLRGEHKGLYVSLDISRISS